MSHPGQEMDRASCRSQVKTLKLNCGFWSSFVLPRVGIRGGGVSSCSPRAQSISVAWGPQISPWVEGILIGNLSTWLIFGVSKAQRISHSVLKGACSKRASRRMELFGSWGWKCLGKGVPKGECSFLGEHAGLGPSPHRLIRRSEASIRRKPFPHQMLRKDPQHLVGTLFVASPSLPGALAPSEGLGVLPHSKPPSTPMSVKTCGRERCIMGRSAPWLTCSSWNMS